MTAYVAREQETGTTAAASDPTASNKQQTTNNSIEYKLGSIEQIPLGEGRQFHLAGQDIAVFRARNGHIYATQAVCPHRDGPLIDGMLGGSVLVCPLHNWKWNLESGQVIMGECALTTYAVHLDADSEIILRVG